MVARLKSPSGPPNAVVAKGYEAEGKHQRPLSPWNKGLTSLFKEVRVFKELPEPAYGERTEQVKTGQVNPDRPLVGPSVDTFVGCFVGSP